MKLLLINLIVVILLLGNSLSCVRHVRPYKAKQRQYELPPTNNDHYSTKAHDGGLYDKNRSILGNDLMVDSRARNLHDIVTILIEENATSSADASTQLDKESEVKAGVSAFLGYLKAIQQANPNTDPTKLIDATSVNKFSGAGKTARSGKMRAIVPAMIKNVLPNGLLFVEGHRVILLNDEEHHFYISGVIRPNDIDTANQISSTLLADAQVEFTGRGNFDLQQGWFSKYFAWVWPF